MSQPFASALACIRERVRNCISVPVSDSEALKICFTCSNVESDALLELSHSRVVRTEANTNIKILSISPAEFHVLLSDEGINSTRRSSMTAALNAEEEDSERKRQLDAIQSSLRLTLKEETQRQLWESNSRVRMRVSLAMLRKEDHLQCLQHALGEILNSDLRLVDDLRCQTAENGIDIMDVAALISAVCTTIA